MTTQDAKRILEDFIAYLRRSPERFVDCLTDEDMNVLIQALEEVAILLIKKRIKEEEIAAKFDELGMLSYILDSSVTPVPEATLNRREKDE